MLAQRIFGIALGYEDLNEHQALRDDLLFQIISERGIKDYPLASPPTLCRLENRVDRKTLADIAKVFVEAFIRSYKTAPDELILDFYYLVKEQKWLPHHESSILWFMMDLSAVGVNKIESL
jgi:hypothetical protein